MVHKCAECGAWFTPGDLRIHCAKDPEIMVIQILDVETTLNQLQEKCPQGETNG